jgi:hypothetical protein
MWWWWCADPHGPFDAVALFDYDKKNDNELNFRAWGTLLTAAFDFRLSFVWNSDFLLLVVVVVVRIAELLHVVGKLPDNEGWWVANSSAGKQGVIPSNFVGQVIGTCKAQFAYAPEDESLKETHVRRLCGFLPFSFWPTLILCLCLYMFS